VARKYFLETYGCQMNYHDSERLAGLLESDGYERTDSEAQAEVIVINTCSVREKAEDKLYTRLGELRELAAETGVDPIVAVTGCVAQQEGARLLKRDSSIDVIVGTPSAEVSSSTRAHRPRASRRRRRHQPLRGRVVPPWESHVTRIRCAHGSPSSKAATSTARSAWCPTPAGTSGCGPCRRSSTRCAPAVDSGRREVQLLGQIVNHYQAPDDPACDFAELLARVSAVTGIERVRFASPHPRHVSDRLIEAIRDLPAVCKHLHLPVQSGSNRVLKNMRRRYTRESYLELIDRLRDAVPSIALSTDMIVGFPGESDADFALTLDLAEKARYHSMFSFKYSPRPNTLAIKRLPDDVTEAEKTRRIVALQDLQRRIQMEHFAGMVGHTFPVLAEAISRRRAEELSGRTSGNSVVNFPGEASLIGQLVPVAVTGIWPQQPEGAAGIAPGWRASCSLRCRSRG
jgi:tRNA-2-methylthio-N6-dimethylallyladenosine synthase